MSESNRYKKHEPLFGSWYIKKKIGKGAVGQVFEIERTEPGITYRAALKAITIPEGPEEIKRVISSGVDKEDLPDYYRKLINSIANEFRYLARLKGNSYIVNYEDHQIIEDENEMRWDVLIKTELLTPLVEHVEEESLDEKDVLRLGMDICRALKFCGSYNILHRDIKPENIFIAPSGSYKLGDFGIARVVEETYVNLSRKGTYTYMAPEVFHGHKYDQSADLYSLGLVMYKYLNYGRIPFMPPYPEKIAFDDPEKAFSERMSGKQVPDPATGSSRLRRVVLKACAYKPEERFSNADEMLTELEDIYLSEKRKNQRSIKRKRQKSKYNDKPRKLSVPAEPDIKPDDTTAEVSSTKPAAAKSSKTKEKKKLTNAQKITAALFAILLIAGAGIYAAIPKEVTDITGIDSEVQLYYDGVLDPEYKVEPDWFKDEPISFVSGDDNVFTVTDKGEIRAASVGEADLTISAKEYSETVHVKIVPKVTSIEGIEKSYSLYTGSSIQLTPSLKPEKFKDEAILYSSSDDSVVAVSKDGTVTTAGIGEATITISAGGSDTSTVIYVSSPPVVSKPASKSKSTSKKSSKKKSGGSSKGYFGDTEYF